MCFPDSKSWSRKMRIRKNLAHLKSENSASLSNLDPPRPCIAKEHHGRGLSSEQVAPNQTTKIPVKLVWKDEKRTFNTTLRLTGWI